MRPTTAVGDRLSVADRPTNVLCGLMQLAAEHGVDGSTWLAGTPLAPEDISNPQTRISYRQASTVVRRALHALPIEGLGLALGERQNLGNFGLLGLAMKTAPDFGEAVRIGIAYQRNSGALMDLALADQEDGCVAAIASAPEEASDLLPFLCEELFSSVMKLVRELIGTDFRPLRLDLGYPAPGYAQRYRDLFGCQVRFDQPRHAMVIERRWLALPFASYNPLTSNQVMTLCRMQLDAQRPRGETTAALESQLRPRLRENPQMAEMAAILHLSERTLRRQLAEEGTSFSAVHDHVRTQHAMELLRDPSLTILAIGGHLGFNDAREFRRAFKRWTGQAPSQVRRAGG